MGKAIDTHQANELWSLMRGTRAPTTLQRAIEESYAMLDNAACDPDNYEHVEPSDALRPIIDALIAEGVLK